MHETISKKLTDKTWSDTQDPELVDALRDVEEIIAYLSAKIYVMTDYLDQYYEAVRTLVFELATGNSPDNDIELSSPTQTDAARDPRVVGNRATRRANRK